MCLIKHAHMYPLMSSKPAVPHLLSGASSSSVYRGRSPRMHKFWTFEEWLTGWLKQNKKKKRKREREREGRLRDAQTSPLISALKSASQVSSVWEISFEKKKRLARDGKREWLIGTLERLWARNNVPQINKPLTSQTGSLKCCVWKSFSHLFIFKIRRASLSSAWKACVSGMCIMADSLPPYAPSTYSILSCFCVLIEALLLLLLLLLSKRRYAKTTHSLFFPFRFLLCGANLTPVLHQVCISLIPLSFNPPLHIYTPAARNEWFTWRGSLPPSEKKSFATIHYSPASISLISLCCVTLEKPLRSSYLVFFLFFCFLFFSSTLSLLLFLWVTFSIDCLCFLMLWRGPGACGWGKSALLDTLTPP